MTPECRDAIFATMLPVALPLTPTDDQLRAIMMSIGLAWREHEPDRTLEVSVWVDDSMPTRYLVADLRSWFGPPRREEPVMRQLSSDPQHGPPDRICSETWQFRSQLPPSGDR